MTMTGEAPEYDNLSALLRMIHKTGAPRAIQVSADTVWALTEGYASAIWTYDDDAINYDITPAHAVEDVPMTKLALLFYNFLLDYPSVRSVHFSVGPTESTVALTNTDTLYFAKDPKGHFHILGRDLPDDPHHQSLVA